MLQQQVFCLLSHSGIGNLILTTPCLVALRKTHPEAKIYLLTWPRSSRILHGWPIVDQIIEYHPPQFIRSLPTIPDAVLLSPTGALWEPKWDQEARQVLRASPGPTWLKHEADYMMDFAYKLGYYGSMPEPQVHIFDTNYVTAAKFQFQHGLRDGEFFCINASYLKTDHWHLKHLGNSKFVSIVNGIHEIFPNNKLVFVGSLQDKNEAANIITACNLEGFLVNACGWSDDIKDTAALFVGARVVIGNDGGLAHIAAAVGTPTVTGFTFTNPIKNRPLGDKSFVVMRSCERRLRCQHSNWGECGPRGCLDIPIDLILDAVNKAVMS